VTALGEIELSSVEEGFRSGSRYRQHPWEAGRSLSAIPGETPRVGCSTAAGRDRQGDSDLDFLVEFETVPAGEYADTYFGLRESLEDLYGRPVDLVVDSAIRNPYFRESVERTKTLLYAAWSGDAREQNSAGPERLIDCDAHVPIANADRAIIAGEKLTRYLLNPSHKRGGAKARLLLSLGYRTDAPNVLETDLRVQHLSLNAMRSSKNAYGLTYEIEGPLKTPSGKIVRFCSIWQIDTGTDVPRLITMYPR
jgi:predicted nucleotidyltransferase